MEARSSICLTLQPVSRRIRRPEEPVPRAVSCSRPRCSRGGRRRPSVTPRRDSGWIRRSASTPSGARPAFPVDDVGVALSDGGFVLVQAKSGVRSARPASSGSPERGGPARPRDDRWPPRERHRRASGGRRRVTVWSSSPATRAAGHSTYSGECASASGASHRRCPCLVLA